MQGIDKAIFAQRLAAWRERRDGRGEYAAKDLLKLARKAAGLALSGSRFSTEDRVEVAAEILSAGLREHRAKYGPGALPTRTDPAHGFTAYYRRAGRERQKLDAKRAAEAAADTAPEVGDFDAAHETLLGGAVEAVRGGTLSIAHAHALTRDALDALGVEGGERSNVYALIYAAARDLGETTVSRELDIQPATLRQRRARGAKILAARFPTAPDLIERLTGGSPVWTFLPEDGEAGYRFTVPGRPWPREVKREGVTTRTGALGQVTRDERERLTWTARGERPADIDEARERCTVRTVEATPTGEDRTDEAHADALQALSFALSR